MDKEKIKKMIDNKILIHGGPYPNICNKVGKKSVNVSAILNKLIASAILNDLLAKLEFNVIKK